MNCGRSVFGEDESAKSSITKTITNIFFLLLNLALLGLPIFRRKKSAKKQKKNCDYCGSDFLFPDTAQNRELVKSSITKN